VKAVYTTTIRRLDIRDSALKGSTIYAPISAIAPGIKTKAHIGNIQKQRKEFIAFTKNFGTAMEASSIMSFLVCR